MEFLGLHRMEVIFALGALAAAGFIWRSLRRMHDATDINFNLRDLLMENDRVSKAACVMMGAFAATTWQFIYYTLNGKLTEGYLGIYVAAWIAPVVARLIAKPESGATQVTTETTTTLTTAKAKRSK